MRVYLEAMNSPPCMVQPVNYAITLIGVRHATITTQKEFVAKERKANDESAGG